MSVSPAAQHSDVLFPRISTGSAALDDVLGGGFPANSINMVMGQPGTGKTVLVEQMLFHNASGDRPVLFFTTLSEPFSKVVGYAQRFAFFREELVGDRVIFEGIGQDLVANGPTALADRVADAIRTYSPRILVIDSFRVVHDLVASRTEARRLISEVAGLLSAYDCTTFLIGEYTRDDVATLPEFAVADGIIELARHTPGRRDERSLRVLKLRGSGYREGQHAFRITPAGIELFPRLVTPSISAEYEPELERIPSGIPGLDPLIGGGVWRGSATLVAGPTGSGKTMFALLFALAGVARGESALVVNFQENPAQLRRTLRGLAADVAANNGQGFHTLYASPVELQIDSIIGTMFAEIQRRRVRRLVVDGIGDLAAAASDPQRLHDYLYALVQHLVVHNVASVMTLENIGPGLFSGTSLDTRFSYMSDNVILLENAMSPGTRTLRVLKTRNSPHDPHSHPLTIDGRGLRVGERSS